MKRKTRSLLEVILIGLACSIAITGCGEKTVVKESVAQTVTKEQNRESENVRLIEQGEQSFLFPMEDGYRYPVMVLKPAFIETMPLKIKLRLLHQRRDVAVPVEMLQSSELLPGEIVSVEVWMNEEWHLLKGAHRFQDQYLGQLNNDTSWQAFDDDKIRIKIINGEKP